MRGLNRRNAGHLDSAATALSHPSTPKAGAPGTPVNYGAEKLNRGSARDDGSGEFSSWLWRECVVRFPPLFRDACLFLRARPKQRSWLRERKQKVLRLRAILLRSAQDDTVGWVRGIPALSKDGKGPGPHLSPSCKPEGSATRAPTPIGLFGEPPSGALD